MMTSWPSLTFLYVLAVHYVGDWLLQTEWMARNKSTSVFALTVHVGVYTVALFVGVLWWIGNADMAMMYAGANGLLHWFVDGATSQATTWAYKNGHRRTFFNVVGFDQLLHQLCLCATLVPLIRG